MSNIDILIEVRSIKNIFRKRLTPGIGNIDRRQRKPSKHEMSMAEIVVKEFGGKIIFLAERGREAIKTPDAIWSGIKLEIKRASGNSSVSNRVRKAISQLGEKGIILLDISRNKKGIEELKNEAIRRVRRSLVDNNLRNIHLQIIFMKNKRIMEILEIKKREIRPDTKGSGNLPLPIFII